MYFSQSLSLNQPMAAKVFSAAIKQNRLVPAYLFTGSVWEDKWQLANELAYYLNCSKVKSGAQRACALGEQTAAIQPSDWCTSCRWLAAGEHPQAMLKLSGQESKSGKITVEQARDLVEEISKTSSYKRVVVIENAEQEVLHRPAANALLRTIEEPRSNVLLIFFAQAISEVLATIVSRCQIISMSNNMYKQQKFFSLYPDVFRPSEFDQLVGEEAERKDALIALDKFLSKDGQFLDAVSLSESMQLLIKEKTDLDRVLDLFVTKALLSVKNFLTVKKEASYVKQLFLLGQIAKEQGKHFVGHKAVVETFVFAWYKLKQTGINPLKVRG